MTLIDPQQTPPLRDVTTGWGQSLSTGAAGIALLHVEQAHSGTGSWASAHGWVAAATRHPVTAEPSTCGLFLGAPAIAFLLHAAGPDRYAPARRTLEGHVTDVVRHRLGLAHARIDRGDPPALREYDLINGLTGLGACLLHLGHDDRVLRDVLRYLVRLADPLSAGGRRVPGWWCPDGPTDTPSPHWRGGHANLGIAHGISGPLAFLATALRHGITVAGQSDTIGRIDSWLDHWRRGTDARPWWPGTVSRTELAAGEVHQHGPQRPSWCYGTPGIARARQLAAIALGDDDRRRRAEAALASCLTDDTQLAQLTEASLCHGWAGALQAAWRVATDADPADESGLGALIPWLRARLDGHLHLHDLPKTDGLLEGQAGVELARLTTTRPALPTSRWDACLLLAG